MWAGEAILLVVTGAARWSSRADARGGEPQVRFSRALQKRWMAANSRIDVAMWSAPLLTERTTSA